MRRVRFIRPRDEAGRPDFKIHEAHRWDRTWLIYGITFRECVCGARIRIAPEK